VTARGTWWAVGLGGAAGALARIALDPGILTGTEPNLWLTLAINVVGAAALGATSGHGLHFLPEAARLGLTTGFLGSFTTFSGIVVVSLLLGLDTQWLWGISYALLTVILGVVAAGLSASLGRLGNRSKRVTGGPYD
jgi:fluoride exporter